MSFIVQLVVGFVIGYATVCVCDYTRRRINARQRQRRAARQLIVR